jgi:uncharacterized phage-associated protein
MKSDITLKLTKEILAVSNKPISKVRLAKMVYFSFKELVMAGYYHVDDLAFIRMPLGPVPFDFYNVLQTDDDIEITRTNVGLSYNRENYSLKRGASVKSTYLSLLGRIVNQLDQYPTSSLVEISHNDSSWLGNSNGDTYYVSQSDLIHFKGIKTIKHSDEIDDQLLQSKLVKGMKEEIIKDSSALEFPDHYPSDK